MRRVLIVIIIIMLCACDTGGIGGGGPTLPVTDTPTTTSTLETPQATLTENASQTVVPSPIATTQAPTKTIIEITPLGGYPRGLGVAVFSLATNVRYCEDSYWFSAYTSPSDVCPVLKTAGGDNEVLQPDEIVEVRRWHTLANGDRWAALDVKEGVWVAVCWRGGSRAMFYSYVTLHEYHDGLAGDGVYGCNVR